MTKEVWPFNKQGFVNVPGGRIWYGVVGDLSSGQTPLLVIHGGPGMSHNYLFPLIDLADDRPVIFYDQLDCGKSDRPNDPVNWAVPRFLQEIDALRNDLNLLDVSIFGNSWGGTLAAAYAASSPEGLKRVILSSPLINTRQWITDNGRHRDALPEEVKVIMETCESTGDTDSPEYQDAVNVFYMRHLCRTDPWPDFVMDSFETMNEALYLGMWGPNEFTCNGVLRNYDGSTDLKLIGAHTLVTVGEFDEATPTSSRKFTRLIPNGEFVEFDGASHLAFVEDRERYIAEVRQFLTR